MEWTYKQYKARWSDGYCVTLVLIEPLSNWKIIGSKREFNSLPDLERFYKSKITFLTKD